MGMKGKIRFFLKGKVRFFLEASCLLFNAILVYGDQYLGMYAHEGKDAVLIFAFLPC